MTAETMTIREAGRDGTGQSAADWLGLAAAPTFAVMALATTVVGSGAQDVFCAAMRGGSPFGGMAAMYLLMSAFHLAPWLRLIAGRQRRALRA